MAVIKGTDPVPKGKGARRLGAAHRPPRRHLQAQEGRQGHKGASLAPSSSRKYNLSTKPPLAELHSLPHESSEGQSFGHISRGTHPRPGQFPRNPELEVPPAPRAGLSGAPLNGSQRHTWLIFLREHFRCLAAGNVRLRKGLLEKRHVSARTPQSEPVILPPEAG